MRFPTSLVNQWPMPARSRSIYGMAAMNVSQIVGTIDAGEALIHVEQELLQVQQVPRRFRRVGRAVDGRVVLQRRVEERRDREEPERPDHHRDEFDDEQMRPHHRRVFDALVDAHDGVLPDESQQPETLSPGCGPRGDDGRVAATRRVGDRAGWRDAAQTRRQLATMLL